MGCHCLLQKVAQSCPTLWDPMDYTVHGILQARIMEWVAFPFPRGSSQPRDQIQVSHIAGRFFTSWTTGKPKNTGVGSLSLLQWIFLTQESNQSLLHCRQIFYPLSYQGIPNSGLAAHQYRSKPFAWKTAVSSLYALSVHSLLCRNEFPIRPHILYENNKVFIWGLGTQT